MEYVDVLPDNAQLGQIVFNNTNGYTYVNTVNGWRLLSTMGQPYGSITVGKILAGNITADKISVVDWQAKYLKLQEEYDRLTTDFNEYRANVQADYEITLGEDLYQDIYKRTEEQVRKDIEVEVYKRAREHVLLQFAEVNERV